MSKNTKLILIFGLVVSLYALSQYMEQQKENTFRTPLFEFLSKDIEKVRITEQDHTSFQLQKIDKKWFVNAQNIYEEAETDAINELLKLIKSIRTTEITSQRMDDWEVYQLTDEEGIVICLEEAERKLPCIRFGSTQFFSEENTLKSFARFDEQKEIYALNGFATSQLKSNIGHYRNKQILNIKEPITKFRFDNDSTSISFFKWNQQWVDTNLTLQDSLLWEKAVVVFSDLSLSSFADNLDELAIREKKLGSLHLFTEQDSFQLDYYQDSTFALPYVLHSSQFPKTWMACDSVAFFELSHFF